MVLRRAPLTEIRTEEGLRLVWLDPRRYTAAERMYVATRVTRSFDHPDEILRGFYLPRSLMQADPQLLPCRTVDLELRDWLAERLLPERHDSVLEFAGLEYAVWIDGLSLGSIRDVDRHRRFSFEEYTTRALGASAKARFAGIEALLDRGAARLDRGQELNPEDREQLKRWFYLHPAHAQDLGALNADRYLLHCGNGLLFYLDNTADSSKTMAPDIYRGVLPLALRTPFLMGGNQRDWFEAAAKRTCYLCGHREYVDLFRALVELFGRDMPFLLDGLSRWCPKLKSGSSCCRTRWEKGLRLL